MIIEFFLGFMAIVFAVAGAALVKLTRGEKPSVGSTTNLQEATKVTGDLGSKIGQLYHSDKLEKFDQYMEKTVSWMKENATKIKQVSKYLLEREKEIGFKLYQEQMKTLEKYFKPIKQLRTKFETYLNELGLLDEANQLENAGYIGKEDLYKVGKNIINVGAQEERVRSYKERISGFFSKAKSGLFRRGH